MAPKPSPSCQCDLFCPRDATDLGFCMVSRLAVFRAGTGFYSKSCCCCSVAQLCLTLCDPVGGSMPGFPILHYHLEFAQTYVLWVSDAIQPSHPVALFFCPWSFPASGTFPNLCITIYICVCIFFFFYMVIKTRLLNGKTMVCVFCGFIRVQLLIFLLAAYWLGSPSLGRWGHAAYPWRVFMGRCFKIWWHF